MFSVRCNFFHGFSFLTSNYFNYSLTENILQLQKPHVRRYSNKPESKQTTNKEILRHCFQLFTPSFLLSLYLSLLWQETSEKRTHLESFPRGKEF